MAIFNSYVKLPEGNHGWKKKEKIGHPNSGGLESFWLMTTRTSDDAWVFRFQMPWWNFLT